MSGHPTHFSLTNELPKITDRWDDIHVMQEGGNCVCSVECPCLPDFDYEDEETGRRVFTHKSSEQMFN